MDCCELAATNKLGVKSNKKASPIKLNRRRPNDLGFGFWDKSSKIIHHPFLHVITVVAELAKITKYNPR